MEIAESGFFSRICRITKSQFRVRIAGFFMVGNHDSYVNMLELRFDAVKLNRDIVLELRFSCQKSQFSS